MSGLGIDVLPRGNIRYDAILLAIPIVFAATFVLVQLTPAGHSTALAVSSISSGLLIGDGLFVNPPSTSDEDS